MDGSRKKKAKSAVTSVPMRMFTSHTLASITLHIDVNLCLFVDLYL